MSLEGRNRLIELAPKLVVRGDLEDLMKAIGHADLLAKVPGGASYEQAVVFVVDQLIAAEDVLLLVDALIAKLPKREDLKAIRAQLAPVVALAAPAARTANDLARELAPSSLARTVDNRGWGTAVVCGATLTLIWHVIGRPAGTLGLFCAGASMIGWGVLQALRARRMMPAAAQAFAALIVGVLVVAIYGST